jgi:hypothetical protein
MAKNHYQLALFLAIWKVINLIEYVDKVGINCGLTKNIYYYIIYT